jgi:hypothetical protein
MEPGQTDPALRPKGFVRRNWGALLFFGSFLFLTVFHFTIIIRPKIGIGCREGDPSLMVAHDGKMEISPAHRVPGFARWFARYWKAEFAAPRLGGVVKMKTDDVIHLVVVPLWLPLSLLAAWMAFREWRRKHAAARP